MSSAPTNSATHPAPLKCAPTFCANAVVTLASPSALPSRSNPPYHTKRSHAARSFFTSSQSMTSESSKTHAPISAVSPISKCVDFEVIHNEQTPTKTPVVTHSRQRSGPIAASSRDAKLAASGVRRIVGGESFITSHGITATEHNPGTDPATSQLVQVM